MISWRRPSKRSSSDVGPFGPSNVYGLSTGVHGIRRRLAASASRARVCAFSSTSSALRAASHSSADTRGGVVMSKSVIALLLVDVAAGIGGLNQTSQPDPRFGQRSAKSVPPSLELGPFDGVGRERDGPRIRLGRA